MRDSFSIVGIRPNAQPFNVVLNAKNEAEALSQLADYASGPAVQRETLASFTALRWYFRPQHAYGDVVPNPLAPVADGDEDLCPRKLAPKG